MGRDFLPRQDVALIDGANRTSTPFYVFLQSLERAVEQGVITRDQFDALQLRVKVLEDAAAGSDSFTMIGSQSVIVYGTPENGFVQLALDGDSNQLGPSWFYGTGPDGVKGFYRLYDAMEAGVGIVKTDSGHVVLGEVDTSADLPGSGAVGDAYRVLDESEAGLWVWDGAAWALDESATGAVGFRAAKLRKIIDFSYGDASPAPVFVAPYDLNVILCRIVIRSGFNGAMPELSAGMALAPGALIGTDESDPKTVGGYEATPDQFLAAGEQILFTINPDGSSSGSGQFIIDTIPLEGA